MDIPLDNDVVEFLIHSIYATSMSVRLYYYRYFDYQRSLPHVIRLCLLYYSCLRGRLQICVEEISLSMKAKEATALD